jgi:hypothetical protein
MKDALLLQVGIGAEFAAMLDASHARHVAYCAAHGFDFLDITEPVAPTPPMWQRYFCIAWAFTTGYQFVATLDADALIANTRIDLRSASTKPLAMKWAQAPGGEPPGYNAGAIFARATSAPLFDEMTLRAPGPTAKQNGPWWLLQDGEQRILNELLRQERWATQTEPLGAFWNCVLGIEDVPQPAVVAWHGIEDTGERLRLMRQWLRTHSL